VGKVREAFVHPRPVANEPVVVTRRSKEMTDKIHRLIRKFSKDLVNLIYQELGARAVKVKGKPGPKPGSSFAHKPCPLCGFVNGRRRAGFVCKTCSGGKKVKVLSRVRKDTFGRDFRVEVPIPEGLPLKPAEVEVAEDVEPDFLDRLVEVVPIAPRKRAAKPGSDDEGFW
jgi:hypothetical protein